jgi:hypothetical protein
MPVMVLLLGVTACSSSSSSGGGAVAANDATLSALEVSSGTLSPAFDSEIVSYAVTVARGATMFQVTPTALSPRAWAVQVKQDSYPFAEVARGAASASYLAPAVGSSTTISIRVIAEDRSTMKTYAIRVTRASGDATLQSLTVSDGHWDQAFASTTYAYTNSWIQYATTSITVTPTVHEGHATVQVKGAGGFEAVASGTASKGLAVPPYGIQSVVTVRVTAQDGAWQDYAITISKADPLHDASLSGLTVNGTSLTLDPSIDLYEATLAHGTTSFSVTPTASDSHATIKVGLSVAALSDWPNGTAWPSPSVPPPDDATKVTVYVRVTAQDRTSTRTYQIDVIQTGALSQDTSLSLSVSPQPEIPLTSTGAYSFVAGLPWVASSLEVTPVVAQHATVKVGLAGAALGDWTNASAWPSPTLPPADGTTPTTIAIRVIAEDTNYWQDYTLDVTRAAPSTDSTLQNLTLSAGSLNPSFTPTPLTTLYTATVPMGTTFNVTPTANDPQHATIQVDQDGSPLVASGASWSVTAPTAYGATTNVHVIVGAQDGSSTTYTIAVSTPQEVIAFFPLYVDTVCISTGDTTAQLSLGGTMYQVPGKSFDAYPTPAKSPGWYDTWHDPSGNTKIDPGSLTSMAKVTMDVWPSTTSPNVVPTGAGWVEFAVSTSGTKSLTVDQISFYGGNGGTSYLSFKTVASTSATDFDNGTKRPLDGMALTSATDQPPSPFRAASNSVYLKGWDAGQNPIVVNPGETLYIRIFPWIYSGTASNTKYLLLQSFRVHGTVQ